MTVSMCVLLWAHPGMDDALGAYEDAVLALVPEHGGTVTRRIRTEGSGDDPLEVQFIELPADGLEAYLADPRRLALAGDRDRAVSRTEIHYLSPTIPGAPS